MSRLGPILAAVRDKVLSLGLAVDGSPLPVLLRKAPARRAKMDPARAVTVSKSQQAEDVSRWTFDRIRTDYVIDVTVVTPFVGLDDPAQATYAEIRDRLVTAFSRPPLAGAPDVFELRARPADWLAPSGEETGWDWQSLQVVASVVSSNGGA